MDLLCDMETYTTSLWGGCTLLCNKAMDLDGVVSDYGAFLLHGELRHLAGTFWPRLVCLLRCWLGMVYGAHDDDDDLGEELPG